MHRREAPTFGTLARFVELMDLKVSSPVTSFKRPAMAASYYLPSYGC